MERDKRTSSKATDIVNQRHQQPISADASGSANLILVQCEFLFRLPEEDLNRPSVQIQIQNFLGRKGAIGAEEGRQRMR